MPNMLIFTVCNRKSSNNLDPNNSELVKYSTRWLHNAVLCKYFEKEDWVPKISYYIIKARVSQHYHTTHMKSILL